MTGWSTLKKLIWLRIIKGGGSALRTVTGAIVHVTNALAMPAKALSVNVSPIQDLHGYDSPWPAGGGVNLIDDTIKTIINNEYLAIGATNLTTFPFRLKPGSFTMKAFGAERCYGYIRKESDTSNIIVINGTSSGTFTISEEANYRIWFYGSAYISDITHVMLVAGETAPTTFSPYSNICPISGRTSATVTRTGLNLFDKNTGIQLELRNLRVARTIGQGVPFLLRKGITYTFSCNSNTPANIYLMVPYSGDGIAGSAGANTYLTYTPENDIEVGFNFFWPNGRPADATDIMVEIGSVKHDFETYAGNTYTIQLGDTVYGGTLDVTGGKMVVDRAMADLGTLNWTYLETYQFFQNSQLPKAKGLDNAKCSVYAYGGWWSGWAEKDCVWCGNLNTSGITIKDTRYTTAADFRAAVSGVQLCYELATPLEITLTPTQIDMLLGENNLWSDAGDSTLTYYAEGEASTSEALGILLGGTYNNPGGADDVSDDEALGILLGGS